MASRGQILINEIRRKLDMLSIESIEMANGSHTTMAHVGKDNKWLLDRIKDEHKSKASTFDTEELLLEAIRDYFNDDYAARRVADFILDPSKNCGRYVDAGAIYDEETDEFKVLGRVAYKNGSIFNATNYSLVLACKGIDYRNKFTGLPFDIVTVTCEEE